MNGNAPVQTQPPSPTDEVLLKKFDEDFADQANRIADMAKQLITIELAIPGLYATILKLLQGKETFVKLGWPVYLIFGFWFLALLLSLAALLPKKYKVDRSVIRRDPIQQLTPPLSLEAYFIISATYKYNWVCASCLCFFAGIITAMFSLF